MTKHEIRTNVKLNRFSFLLENGFKLIPLKQAKRPSFADWPNKGHIDGCGSEDGSEEAGGEQVDLGLDPKEAIERAVKSASTRLEKKKNVGAVLPPGVVVIDIDTSVKDGTNDGEAQFRELLAAHGGMDLQVFLTSTYSVKTGGGGYHLFFRYDESKHLHTSLKRVGCPSVDVLRGTRFVVTPGCGHDSGGIYEQVERSPLEIRPLPQWLADLVFTDLDDLRSIEDDGQASSLCNVVSPAELSKLLAALDPLKYKDYGSWFALIAASHHATGGDPEAMVTFADWSVQDPEFANEARDEVEVKWKSVHLRRQRSKGLATVRSLLSAVGRAVAEARAVNRPLGLPESPVLSDAFELMSKLRKKLVEDLLQPVIPRSGKEEFLDLVAGMQGRWASLPTGDKRRVFERAAQFDDLEWPSIADAIASASSQELTKKKVEIAIRNERKKAEKVQKAVEKQEQADSELTTPMLVELIAEQSITKVFGDKKNVGWASNEIIYHYKDGVWAPVDKAQVENTAYEVSSNLVDTKKEKSKTLSQYANLAVDTVRHKTLKGSANLHAMKQLPDCINLKNGTMRFRQRKPPVFGAHNREDYLTSQILYDYDPGADCPGFIEMLHQVFVEIENEFGTQERDDYIRHFFELVGYMIQPNKNIPIVWIWSGEGKNGKTRIAKILSKLVGGAWLDSDLRSFDSDKSPHMLHSLEGKLVLLDRDAKIGTRLDDGLLKKISESGDILVNPKNKAPYTIRLQVTPLILTNNTLAIDDLSKGMLRRLEITEFGADLSPIEDSDLPDIVEAKQIPGILNHAISGYARLVDRGKLQHPASSGVFHHRNLIKANTLYAFWASLSKTPVDGASIAVSEAYSWYKQFMLDRNEGRALSLPRFTEDLKRCGARVKNGNIESLAITRPDY